MGYPPGSKLGMSSCAIPSPYIRNSPQTSSHTRTKYANLAESSWHQPGLCTIQSTGTWLPTMPPWPGLKKMRSSTTIFYRRRPSLTALIAMPMVIVPWPSLWDQSLLSPFVPAQPPPPPLASHRPSPALPSSQHRPSHSSKEPSVATSTVVPAAASIVNLGTSATNQIGEEPPWLPMP